MGKLKFVLAAVVFALFFHPASTAGQAPPATAPTQQQPSPSAPQATANSAVPQAEPQRITAYRLPPELYKKTERLSRIRLAFILIGAIYGVILLWLILGFKLAL